MFLEAIGRHYYNFMGHNGYRACSVFTFFSAPHPWYRAQDRALSTKETIGPRRRSRKKSQNDAMFQKQVLGIRKDHGVSIE